MLWKIKGFMSQESRHCRRCRHHLHLSIWWHSIVFFFTYITTTNHSWKCYAIRWKWWQDFYFYFSFFIWLFIWFSVLLAFKFNEYGYGMCVYDAFDSSSFLISFLLYVFCVCVFWVPFNHNIWCLLCENVQTITAFGQNIQKNSLSPSLSFRSMGYLELVSVAWMGHLYIYYSKEVQIMVLQ